MLYATVDTVDVDTVDCRLKLPDLLTIRVLMVPLLYANATEYKLYLIVTRPRSNGLYRRDKASKNPNTSLESRKCAGFRQGCHLF